ncbi:putative Phosphatidylglycerol/phosphatidylinositol transfer protein [Tricharina praecox]|uniref:putative Phosphatidylglycerol/phosphatidylinositol transfer protein n=1 Tax=Tricharina praecox TaxID=43433 RepID=UPI0022207848|nr:putative Phosphatidylglycerol/phosphatidylinositol transfer protein [Tricharina praecox]KAI5855966.1 putative Phosphatidylglycerol/phosphatidylinositol transfer protein [Tricharina praecox]
MKFSVITSVLFMAVSVSAGSFFQQQSIDVRSDVGAGLTKVPGANPLFYCGDNSKDIVKIQSLNLTPNPPLPGKTLVVDAVGSLKSAITKGAKVDVSVKYGLITMFKQTADICDNLNQVDLECPVKAGKLTLTKAIDIPNQIPPGTYVVTANAYMGDGRPILCVQGAVRFTLSGKAVFI